MSEVILYRNASSCQETNFRVSQYQIVVFIVESSSGQPFRHALALNEKCGSVIISALIVNSAGDNENVADADLYVGWLMLLISPALNARSVLPSSTGTNIRSDSALYVQRSSDSLRMGTGSLLRTFSRARESGPILSASYKYIAEGHGSQ